MKGAQAEEKAPAEKYGELPVRWGFRKGDISCQILLVDQASCGLRAGHWVQGRGSH